VESADDRRSKLQKRSAHSPHYESVARKLSAKRKESARELGKRVEQELAALAMEDPVEIRVVTNMDPAEWSTRLRLGFIPDRAQRRRS
jgi:DNA repair ATPase RecN